MDLVSDAILNSNETLIESTALSSVELLRGLPSSCLRFIEEKSEVRDYRAGHVFFRYGEKGEVLFFLEKGHVQTFRISGKKKLIIADLKPPAVFGEMSCAGQHMYHCSAHAIQPSRIRSISRENMELVFEQYPEVTRRLLDLVSQRFLSVLQNLEETSFKSLIPRLAKLLLQNADENHVRDITQKEIAEHLRVYGRAPQLRLVNCAKQASLSIQRKSILLKDRMRPIRASHERG